ncbi:hypothetical protein V5799_004894 [Amblyomma americanum]|uniref:MAM domain-containing protein n=1 Tax=Amblyomma americanum TaxID=6943 RepID=A0AAQ4D4T7_AMBAM
MTSEALFLLRAGHCTFEGGYCGWQNADTDDDFNWEQGRGSQSFLTGPSRDYSSFGKDEMTGKWTAPFVVNKCTLRIGSAVRIRSLALLAEVSAMCRSAVFLEVSSKEHNA